MIVGSDAYALGIWLPGWALAHRYAHLIVDAVGHIAGRQKRAFNIGMAPMRSALDANPRIVGATRDDRLALFIRPLKKPGAESLATMFEIDMPVEPRVDRCFGGRPEGCERNQQAVPIDDAGRRFLEIEVWFFAIPRRNFALQIAA